MTKDALSSLRRQLSEKLDEVERLLKPAFDPAPLLPGVITVSRHGDVPDGEGLAL